MLSHPIQHLLSVAAVTAAVADFTVAAVEVFTAAAAEPIVEADFPAGDGRLAEEVTREAAAFLARLTAAGRIAAGPRVRTGWPGVREGASADRAG